MKLLKDFLDSINITIDSNQMEQLNLYREMLSQRNKTMNLTSINDPQDVEMKHFIDSVSIIPYLQQAISKAGTSLESCNIIDVGTGAGFPGLPLKIIFPDIKITLMDSLQKRVVFLQDVVDSLKLKDINCLHGRAEDMAQLPQHREKYDIAVARAVAPLPVLSEYCLPFVRNNMIFAAMKSKLSEEIDISEYSIKVLGGQIETLHEFYLPGTDMFRSLLIIRKKSATPPKYPRKAGKPEKEPLKSPR